MIPSPPSYGLIAEFAEPDQVLDAARRAHEAGYRCMDAYTPAPVPGLAEALGHRTALVMAPLVLAAALGGAAGGYFLQWYAMGISYPIQVAGRALNSWPSFIPISLELSILSGAVTAFMGMMWLCRLPQPYHPVFNTAGFERASDDRYFLCIESVDPKFRDPDTRHFLETLGAMAVQEVPR